MAITTEEDLAAAVAQMKRAGTDLSLYELKDASGGFPQSSVETISSFANTFGGTLIFGISEKNFHPVLSIDVKQIQSQLAQAARERVQPAVAADVRVLVFEDQPIVIANIPEISIREKPCYVKKNGRVNGSYIRTGDGDHKMSLYEIDRFMENQQRAARHDYTLVREATQEDLDTDLVAAWIANERRTSFGRTDRLDNQTLLANRRVIAQDDDGTWHPTIGGLLALGSYPQKFFPRLNVTFTSYSRSSKEIKESKTGALRYRDAANIDGSIPEIIVDTLKILSRNMRNGAIVKEKLRQDVPDYPLVAVREAIANALMHRDYSPEAMGTPVLVDLYSDRLEISNPGGIYGTLSVEDVDKGSATFSRNQFLARILESVTYTDIDGSSGHVVENRGTGFPVMRAELAAALMEPPMIESSLREFRITFKHKRRTTEEDTYNTRTNIEGSITMFLRTHESASTTELAQTLNLSPKTIREYLNILIESGTVEGIGSLYSPKRRYRLVTE
ncbi:MAG: ATP-binding protein [Actinomycetaceae bacterium]|nr:ATP-binding protein [Actinomycetaceae bacterium]MDY6082429.1 ATP-binding protein [Actinomycetaceae bacterium]